MRRLQKLTIKPLPFKMNALEPIISEQILTYHYGKHHVGYVTNFNKTLENYNKIQSEGKDASHLLKGLNFTYGGHVNHQLYWENLAGKIEGGGVVPQSKNSELIQQIEKEFKSFDEFRHHFNTQATTIMGSGWTWLVWDKKAGKMRLISLANQELVEDQEDGALVPLLTIDMWEHAYYLQYKNDKVTYVNKLWEVMNWKEIERRFSAAV